MARSLDLFVGPGSALSDIRTAIEDSGRTSFATNPDGIPYLTRPVRTAGRLRSSSAPPSCHPQSLSNCELLCVGARRRRESGCFRAATQNQLEREEHVLGRDILVVDLLEQELDRDSPHVVVAVGEG